MLFLLWETGQPFPLWAFESGGWIPYSRRQKATLSDKGSGIGLATWLPRDGPWSSPRRRKRAAPWTTWKWKTLQKYRSTDAGSPRPYPRNRILKATHKLMGATKAAPRRQYVDAGTSLGASEACHLLILSSLVRRSWQKVYQVGRYGAEVGARGTA